MLDARYHKKRLVRRDVIYRLKRRTSEVERAIRRFSVGMDCLDVGAADGAMLSELKSRIKLRRATGIEKSKDLIAFGKGVELIAGDAQDLPFADKSFDIAVASALIEHVDSPATVVDELVRVLRDDGIVVVTFPTPLHNIIGRCMFYIPRGEHKYFVKMEWLSSLFERAGLEVVYKGGFMVCPFFRMPSEQKVETFLNRIGLGMAMSNQVIVGKAVADLNPAPKTKPCR